MSSNYTGNPSATQAPGATPGLLVLPTITIPADGDPLAASSVTQMVKEPADFIAYLQQQAAVQNYTFVLSSSTPTWGSNTGTIIDSTIDWRHRIIWIDAAYIGSAATSLHSITTPVALPFNGTGGSPLMQRLGMFTGTGGNASNPIFTYNGSGNGAVFQVDSTSGVLRVSRQGTVPIDATNGDNLIFRITTVVQY